VTFSEGLYMPRDIPLLPVLLRDAGYQTAAFSGTYFRFSLTGFDRGFSVFDESCADAFFRNSAECLSKRILEWFEGRGDAPFFCYIHYIDPHAPYYPPEEYRDRFTSGLQASRDAVKLGDAGRFGDGRKWYQFPLSPGPEDVEYLTGLYDAEIAYVDAHVNKLLSMLERRGLAGETFIILTADHGEALFEHGIGEHRSVLYEEVMKVPFILAGPGIPSGKVVSTTVRTVDFFPTVLWLADAGANPLVKEAAAGRSLEPLLQEGSLPSLPAKAMRELGKKNVLYAVRDYPWKLIIQANGSGAELYNLAADPGEKLNLAGTYPDEAKRLGSMLPLENRE